MHFEVERRHRCLSSGNWWNYAYETEVENFRVPAIGDE
jgi:hypothetical protein